MEYCYVDGGYKLLLEKSTPTEKFEELFSKIQKRFDKTIEPSSVKIIVDIFDKLGRNERITYITPYLRLAVMKDWLGEDDSTERQLDIYNSEKDKLTKRDGGLPYIETPLESYGRDVEHFFGSELYNKYLKDYNFSGKNLSYSQHKSEMESIIKSMENGVKKFIDISSDDVDGQDMILSGKDSNGMYYEWWSTNTRSCNSKESSIMNHCGSNENATNMLSLRILVGEDVKKEYGISDKEFKNLRKPVVTFAMKGKTLIESHGNSNIKPEKKYHEAIVAILNSDYIELISQHKSYNVEDTFKLKDLSQKLRDEVDVDEETEEAYDYESFEDFERDVYETLDGDEDIDYTISTDSFGDGIIFSTYGIVEIDLDISNFYKKVSEYLGVLGFDKVKDILIEFDIPSNIHTEFDFDVSDWSLYSNSDNFDEKRLTLSIEYWHKLNSIHIEYTSSGSKVIVPEKEVSWENLQESLNILISAVKSIENADREYAEDFLMETFGEWFEEYITNIDYDEDWGVLGVDGSEKFKISDKSGHIAYPLVLNISDGVDESFYDSDLFENLSIKMRGESINLEKDIISLIESNPSDYDSSVIEGLNGVIITNGLIHKIPKVSLNIVFDVAIENLDVRKFIKSMDSIKNDFIRYTTGGKTQLENRLPIFNKTLSQIYEIL